MGLKSLLQEFRASVAAIFVLGVVLCGAYPLVVWGIGQVAFRHQANGSLIERDGKIIGSGLIAQPFKGDQYFHPRPSAAGENGYDAAGSAGSNLGPLSRKLIEQVKERVEAYRAENNLPPGAKIPADAVTASGSGLDPHISIRNAELQAARVGRARGMTEEDVKKYVARFSERPDLGIFGEPRVNVLELNLALDARKAESDVRRQGP
ncbi:MAG: K(+)-transporting ATPase subunit C [Syntrophobacteraceae bacterium]